MHGIPADQVEEERAHDLLDRCGEGAVCEGNAEAYPPHRAGKTYLEAARVHQRPTEVRLVAWRGENVCKPYPIVVFPKRYPVHTSHKVHCNMNHLQISIMIQRHFCPFAVSPRSLRARANSNRPQGSYPIPALRRACPRLLHLHYPIR